jgi:hypothetical protein
MMMLRKITLSTACVSRRTERRCLLLIGCLFASRAAFPEEAPTRIFDLAIPKGSPTAQTRVLRVYKNELVRLRVTSDEPGEIHLHAFRLEARVRPGMPAELTFEARATGRFRIEWHTDGKRSNHHGPPLATLEVRPQ